MKVKHLVWRSLPSFLKPAAVLGHAALNARHYYGDYVLRNGRSKLPRDVTLEITFRCNLRCVMCPLAPAFDQKDSQIVQEWKHEQELTTDEIIGMIDDCAKMGVKSFGITGGEAFIRKDVLDLVCHVKDRAMECRLTTNGTLMDQEHARRLVDAGVDSLQLSLDGPEEVHSRIRQNPQAYKRTLDSARWTAEAKKRAGARLPVVTFLCTVSAANMDHLLPMVDIARQVNANIRFGHLFYTTEAMAEQTDAILPMGHVKGENQDVSDELKAIDPDRLYAQVCQVKRRADELKVIARFLPDLNRDEIRRQYQDDAYSYVSKCFHPWMGLRVNPYGSVYPCSMNVEMGNVRHQHLSAIWNGPKYVEFRQQLKKERLFPKCAKCCVLTNKMWDYLPKI